jgi:hypothetical protein
VHRDIEHVRSRSHEFNQLLPQDNNNKAHDVEVISKDAALQPDEEQGIRSITKKIQDHVRSYSSKDELQAESNVNLTELQKMLSNYIQISYRSSRKKNSFLRSVLSEIRIYRIHALHK